MLGHGAHIRSVTFSGASRTAPQRSHTDCTVPQFGVQTSHNFAAVGSRLRNPESHRRRRSGVTSHRHQLLGLGNRQVHVQLDRHLVRRGLHALPSIEIAAGFDGVGLGPHAGSRRFVRRESHRADVD